MSKKSWVALIALVGILALSVAWGLPYGRLNWVDKVFAQVYGETETESGPVYLADGSLAFESAIGAKTVMACPYFLQSFTTGAFIRYR